jgi:hypothetical protein
MSENVINAPYAFLQNRIAKDLRFLFCIDDNPDDLREAHRAYRQDRSVIVRHTVRQTPWTEAYLRENDLLLNGSPTRP